MRKVYCEITGKELFLPDRCERIVSFSPAVTEALFEMGLGEFVLGVSVYCVRPQIARKKVIVGSYNTFNEEKLRKLNPDIIFTTTGYQLDLIKNLGEKFQVYPVRLPPSVSEIISTSYEARKYFPTSNLSKYACPSPGTINEKPNATAGDFFKPRIALTMN